MPVIYKCDVCGDEYDSGSLTREMRSVTFASKPALVTCSGKCHSNLITTNKKYAEQFK